MSDNLVVGMTMVLGGVMPALAIGKIVSKSLTKKQKPVAMT